jgi:hypothetical protein
MSDIFREVDEDLRRDRLEQLWKRYGAWIIAAALLIVGATAAFTAWREYQAYQARLEGVAYTEAVGLAQAGQQEQAIDALAGIADGADDGHGLLARFEAAALRAQEGDKAAAIAAYQAIADDGGIDQLYRDLATVLGALHAIGDGEAQPIIARLQPIASGDSPWRPTALEVTALAQLRAGDKAAALETYKRLADDLAAPPGLRGRAAEMVQALGTG